MRRLLCAAFALLLLAGVAEGKSIFPSQYDDQIAASVKRYWPDFPDWKSFKAQLYQESRLNPEAQSSVGAQGLAQMMPATWADISRQLGYGTISRKLAGPAIDGGAYYMAQLRRTWSGRGRAPIDRQALAQASYNAGTGSVLTAQRRCVDALLWASIAFCLADVTGPANARQTIDYVNMISYWRRMMP